MTLRPRLLALTLMTLALTACGGTRPPAPLPNPTPMPSPMPTPDPTPVSLVPTATITSGAAEKGGDNGVLPTTVTITGTNLQGATVEFGDVGPGTEVSVNAAGTVLTVVAPPNRAGRYPVIVRTPNGRVNAGVFTYRQGDPRPSVRLLSVSPINGPAAGGTLVTLTFDGSLSYSSVPQEAFVAPDVYFGSVKAKVLAAPSDGPITAVAPAGSGFVDITLKCSIASCYTFSTTNSVPFQYLP